MSNGTQPTVLFVFAHPDDEALFCGGMIARTAAQGARVVCVFATCGEHAGRPRRWTRKIQERVAPYLIAFPKLMALQDLGVSWLAILSRIVPYRKNTPRRFETTVALRFLGVKDVRFLEFPDGDVRRHVSSLSEMLSGIMEECRPEKVFSFHTSGITGHRDHRAVSVAVLSSVRSLDENADFSPQVFGVAVSDVRAAAARLPFKTVPRSEISLRADLTRPERKRKIRAIRAYESQRENIWVAAALSNEVFLGVEEYVLITH